MKYYNTFISYRRTSGSTEATLLYYALREKGISVFMDVRQSDAGHYPERIMEILNKCENLVLVLAGDTLSECTNETDWVRKELIAANDASLKIIPVVFPNSSTIPKTLPEEITKIHIPSLQSIEYTHEHSDSTIEQLITYLKNSIDKDQCVELLLKSLDSPCKSLKLGTFILGSSEMRLQTSCESHLLTNNLRDYDMTVIAEIAISTNVANGVKYIYYCPSECFPDFQELKTRVNWYLGKNQNALHEIDRWIRAYYISNAEVCIWLNRINKLPPDSIIADFFTPVCDECKRKIKRQLQKLTIRDVYAGREQVDVTALLNWIIGDVKTTPKTKKVISHFGKITESICDSCSSSDDFSLSEWKKHSDFLLQLLNASNWILAADSEKYEFESATDFLYRIQVDEQIILWLQNSPKSQSEIADALARLFFITLSEEVTPVKCCYSFSLLLNPDGSICAAGWYKASARRTQVDTQDVRENDLMIKGLDGGQKSSFKNILVSILNQNIELKNKIDSSIFKE